MKDFSSVCLGCDGEYRIPVLRDHCVSTRVVCPATGFTLSIGLDEVPDYQHVVQQSGKVQTTQGGAGGDMHEYTIQYKLESFDQD